jgi:hypothetical protein
LAPSFSLLILSSRDQSTPAKTKHVKLTVDNVFFLIEGQDKTLKKFAADAMCSTWLRHVPPQNVRIYSDTSFQLPNSCLRIGANHTFPCHPNNATLGDSIATAQYKRENIHLNFAQDVNLARAANSQPQISTAASSHAPLPSAVRWIVSTEQDTWWDTKTLLRYLRYLEETEQNIHDGPASGAWKWGPFLIFNVKMLDQVLGNETFMDNAREQLLSVETEPTLDLYRYPGALYNNDHLVQAATRLCIKSVANCKSFNTQRCRKFAEHAAFVFSPADFAYSSSPADSRLRSNATAAASPQSFPHQLDPHSIASFHHVKSKQDMMSLEESASKKHAQNRVSTTTSALRPCMIWKASDFLAQE